MESLGKRQDGKHPERLPGPTTIMMTSAMCLLRVLLLWALLCLGKGNGDQEEIFTRPGSDLLIPIRHHLTLNHTERSKCDQYEWKYKNPTGTREDRIFIHGGCTLDKSEDILFSNMRISENGNLIISNVTLENDGIYSVEIYKSRRRIQTDYYRVHVEVPVSVPLLNVTWLQNDSTEISCRVEAGTKPNISLSVIGRSQLNYSASANNLTAIVRSPGPWNITCTVENGVSRLEKNRTGVTRPVSLSDIALTSSCLLDGSAVAECSVKGSDPHYSWRLNGRFVSSHSRVILSPPVSGTFCCDVTNEINHLNTSIDISCAVPVSDPVLDVKCLQNKSIEISCGVKNGTDPSIYLTVNGKLEVYNVTSSEQTVRVTKSPASLPESWKIKCSAKNDISERSTNRNHDACPAPLSTPKVMFSSQNNGSVSVFCVLEEDQDVTYTWKVNGELHERSHSRIITFTKEELYTVLMNVSCSVNNSVSKKDSNNTQIFCPEKRRSGWGHLLSHGAVCFLYTALLIYIVTDLRKMKNEKNRSERRTRRRDQTEMEMEPTYCN